MVCCHRNGGKLWFCSEFSNFKSRLSLRIGVPEFIEKSMVPELIADPDLLETIKPRCGQLLLQNPELSSIFDMLPCHKQSSDSRRSDSCRPHVFWAGDDLKVRDTVCTIKKSALLTTVSLIVIIRRTELLEIPEVQTEA
jgi:hypothetical protein